MQPKKPLVTQTIRAGIDTPNVDTWRDEVVSTLNVSTDTSKEQFWHVLYMPSFHPECYLMVETARGKPVIILISQQTNLWNWECHLRMKANGKLLPGDPIPKSPVRWQETCEVQSSQFANFLRNIPKQFPQPSDEMIVFVDGISVHCRFRRADGEIIDASSRGPDDPAIYRLAVAVLDLALNVFDSAESVQILKDIGRYIE